MKICFRFLKEQFATGEILLTLRNSESGGIRQTIFSYFRKLRPQARYLMSEDIPITAANDASTCKW